MDTYQFSSLGRTLDPRYPTNRWIIIIGFLVGAGGLVYRLVLGEPLLEAVWWAFQAAAMVGLAWVLGRELDPDHEYAAFVGVPLALVGVWLLGPGSILAGVWLVQILRMVNRTAGLAAKLTDSLVVLAFCLWTVYQGGWVYGAVTALAFALDALLPQGNRRQLLFAALALVGTLVLVAVTDAGGTGGSSLLTGTSLPAWSVAVGAAVLFLPVIASARRVCSVGDASGEPLQPRRVQAAQVLTLLGGLGLVLLRGESGLAAWLPYWSAVVGLALFRVLALLRLV